VIPKRKKRRKENNQRTSEVVSQGPNSAPKKAYTFGRKWGKGKTQQLSRHEGKLPTKQRAKNRFRGRTDSWFNTKRDRRDVNNLTKSDKYKIKKAKKNTETKPKKIHTCRASRALLFNCLR
jgi:hypothetical protein